MLVIGNVPGDEAVASTLAYADRDPNAFPAQLAELALRSTVGSRRLKHVAAKSGRNNCWSFWRISDDFQFAFRAAVLWLQSRGLVFLWLSKVF